MIDKIHHWLKHEVYVVEPSYLIMAGATLLNLILFFGALACLG
jgi:hypothetical protein